MIIEEFIMKNFIHGYGGRWLILLAFIACIFVPMTIQGQDAKSLVEELASCQDHYWLGEFEEGLACANDLLAKRARSPLDSVAVLEVLSILNLGAGKEYEQRSIDCLKQIFAINPCLIRLPRELWPPELKDQWYRLTNGTDAFTCSDQSRSDVKTIAIMPFDNHSVTKYQEELGPIGKGLAEMFRIDFQKISSLDVVERSKIDFVMQEQKLQQSGAVDKSTAVKAGKLLGAQYMVFGSFMQMDKNNTALMVRVVSVETSEIIASVDKRGKPDYWKFCQELVVELAEDLDLALSDDVKKLIKEGGTESLDATKLYAKGLEFSDKYEYQKAYESFKQAYELDSSFVEAKNKMEWLAPLVS